MWQDVPGDMTDYWTMPVSYFLATPGGSNHADAVVIRSGLAVVGPVVVVGPVACLLRSWTVKA